MPDGRVGVYPGTFDPVTNGHLDIISRAAGMVDKLVVGVAVNAGKGPLFTLTERVAMVREEVKHFGADVAARIEVQPFRSLQQGETALLARSPQPRADSAQLPARRFSHHARQTGPSAARARA